MMQKYAATNLGLLLQCKMDIDVVEVMEYSTTYLHMYILLFYDFHIRDLLLTPYLILPFRL